MKPSFTIMIVDDDEDDRSIFCDVVNQLFPNANCMQFENGCKALQYLDNRDNYLPDLIFLDINMPKLNGKQCLVAIKKPGPAASIPIIIYSTSRLSKDKEEMMHLGADAFLSKPTRTRDLEKALKEIILSFYENKITNRRDL